MNTIKSRTPRNCCPRLRPSGRGVPYPSRRPQQIHRPRHAHHSGHGISLSGKRGSPLSCRFAQQSPAAAQKTPAQAPDAYPRLVRPVTQTYRAAESMIRCSLHMPTTFTKIAGTVVHIRKGWFIPGLPNKNQGQLRAHATKPVLTWRKTPEKHDYSCQPFDSPL
jgi:hypothetical protein